MSRSMPNSPRIKDKTCYPTFREVVSMAATYWLLCEGKSQNLTSIAHLSPPKVSPLSRFRYLSLLRPDHQLMHEVHYALEGRSSLYITLRIQSASSLAMNLSVCRSRALQFVPRQCSYIHPDTIISLHMQASQRTSALNLRVNLDGPL